MLGGPILITELSRDPLEFQKLAELKSLGDEAIDR